MTFSVLLIKDHQPHVVGILWADDEANAKSLAPLLYGSGEGNVLEVCRTEDREIPFRLATPQYTNFC